MAIAQRAADKLARNRWHLLKFKPPFNPAVFAKEEEKMKRKKLQRLQTIAATLNYSLVPN